GDLLPRLVHEGPAAVPFEPPRLHASPLDVHAAEGLDRIDAYLGNPHGPDAATPPAAGERQAGRSGPGGALVDRDLLRTRRARAARVGALPVDSVLDDVSGALQGVPTTEDDREHVRVELPKSQLRAVALLHEEGHGLGGVQPLLEHQVVTTGGDLEPQGALGAVEDPQLGVSQHDALALQVHRVDVTGTDLDCCAHVLLLCPGVALCGPHHHPAPTSPHMTPVMADS